MRKILQCIRIDLYKSEMKRVAITKDRLKSFVNKYKFKRIEGNGLSFN